MSELKCRTCGAELLPATSFCRRCGAAISPDMTNPESERPTTLLNHQLVGNATQRLDARPTAGDVGGINLPMPSVPAVAITKPRKKGTMWRRGTIGVAVMFVILLCATVAVVKLRTHIKTKDSSALLYPGAHAIVDINDRGGRAIQLQTSDPFDKVETWYQNTLRPLKTLRLTSTTVVMKNENTTATIAAEDSMTSIVIKVTP